MITSKIVQRKMSISLTNEVENYFQKIFELLDYEKHGKISDDAWIYFMTDSGLDNKTLNDIFLLVRHKYINYINKEEFLIMLRLIALALNKIPFTESSLEKNNPINPIPPLPKFNYFQKINLLKKDNVLEIIHDIEKTYLKILNEKKTPGKIIFQN